MVFRACLDNITYNFFKIFRSQKSLFFLTFSSVLLYSLLLSKKLFLVLFEKLKYSAYKKAFF